ncbi:hypothetical protein AVEN_203516-1 [Araneus ventricosus]|uniref:Uncharacterized protein n=1 Tax=Araneus ventricosus TaxID=182803 RepID=A0A4Y2PV89_ARAVE|nr:hypothetical protein AVEN_203516-1 [Araneus ventricosus]
MGKVINCLWPRNFGGPRGLEIFLRYYQVIEGRDSSLCVVLLKNPVNFMNHFLLGFVPQHRTLKLHDTRQDREQHHETSTQTRMTERHHGKKMAPVAPPTIERRRQLIVTATRLI